MTYAEGGTVSYANGKRIHTFTDSGTLVVTEAGTVEALVVAGGGAGGGDYAHTGTAFGGGGGGGVVYTSALTVGLGNVAVTVGEGGVSATVAAGSITDAQNSSITDGDVNFTTQTAIKGGTSAQNGGSGGGGSGGGSGTGGTGTAGQGNDGGNVTNFFTGAAGGGGAAAAGSDAPASDFTDTAGAGGAGYLSSISGTATRYGAGGGGGAWKEGYGIGGLGGGGDGGSASADGTTQYQSGLPGTGYGAGGGGQGGQWGAARSGGPGHKGVVIFSYDSDFTTGRRVAQNEDLADMTASTIKGRITTTGIPQDLTAAQVAGILDTEITERAQDAVGAMVADTATIDLTYTDATPALTADVKVDSINDTHIDWGTGTNQVSLDDVPDGSTYVRITAANHTDLTDAGDSALHYHATDRDRANHTGTQLAATISNFAAGVRSSPLTSLSLATVAVISAADNVLGAFGKLQAQITAHDHDGGDGAAIPLTSGVTGVLPAANGGTGINNSTRTLTINTNAGTIDFSAAASTLTVPESMVSAGRNVANTYTEAQTISNTTDSTSYITGALLVSGGVGIAKSVSINGNVGIGQAASAGAGLFLLRTATDTSGAVYGLNGGVFSNPASASSANITGAQVTARTNVANAQNHTGTIAGGLFTAFHRGSGTATALIGGRFSLTNDGGGTVTDAVTLSVLSATNSSGTITNNYGLLINNQTAGTTLNYAIYTGTGLVRFGDTTDTTSASTGALIVSGGVGIAKALYVGTTITALGNVTLGGAADPKLILNEGNTGTSLFEISDLGATQAQIKKTSASGVALIDIDPIPSDGSSNSAFRFFRFTNTTGQVYLQIFKGDGTSTTGAQISGSAAAFTYFGTQSHVGVGTASPAGKLHVVGLTDDEQFIVDFYSTQSTVSNPIRFRTSAGADVFTFSALGAFLSTGATGGIGYTTGAGGTVTQATSKATGVTLNKVTGLITMNNAALAADTTVSFTLTSSAIAATDTIILQHNSAGTVGAYTFGAQPAAGSAVINVRNVTAGSLSEAIVIRYTVIKSISA